MEFLLGVLAAVVALLSPWTRGRSYEISCVGKADCGRINGLADVFADAERADGRPNTVTVNLILVHGMGAGENTDYTPLTNDLAAYLDLYHASSSDVPIPTLTPGKAPAQLFMRNYRAADGSREVAVYELHWWPLIQQTMYRLNFGESWPKVNNIRRQIVAVSDPSDLLSYPIPESISQTGTTFFNVTRPLGHRLALGMLVDPLGAHTGAKSDGRIIKLIACGFPSSCATDKPPKRRRSRKAA